MDDEARLYDKYQHEVQPLFAETEVQFVYLPVDALYRIEDFFDAMAMAHARFKQRNTYYELADLALEQAKCHCYYALATSYGENINKLYDQYGVDSMIDVDDGGFKEQLVILDKEMRNAIAEADDARESEKNRLLESPDFRGVSYEKIEDEVESIIAKSPDVQQKMKRAYESAKECYNLFTRNRNKLNYSQDYSSRNNATAIFNTKSGKVATMIGTIGIVIWFIRTIIGISLV